LKQAKLVILSAEGAKDLLVIPSLRSGQALSAEGAKDPKAGPSLARVARSLRMTGCAL